MAVRECEKCGHSMRMIKFADDLKKRLTCPDCGWRKHQSKVVKAGYPRVVRALKDTRYNELVEGEIEIATAEEILSNGDRVIYLRRRDDEADEVFVDAREVEFLDYPHINRILVILGKNGPSGNADGRPYPFPQKCPIDFLNRVEVAVATFFDTDQQLEDFLYDERNPPKPSIVWQFAERVFNGFYYD